MTDIKKLFNFVENTLSKESILTISVYLHKWFVRNSREQFIVNNSEPA